MSRSKEKQEKQQKKQEVKMLERIHSAKVTSVAHEERKKRPALPNRLNMRESTEEEQNEQQDMVEKATMVYRQMLPSLLKKLSKIKDPRRPGSITHKLTVLMVYGILMFVEQSGSRREMNRTMTRIHGENLQAMFPELETMPHADTLARLLERIDVSEIQKCMIELEKELIRKKKFKNYLIRKNYRVAIDGTQKLFRDYQWNDNCMVRHVGGEERIPQYYVYVLESVLVLDNGITLPFFSEFLKNGEYIEGVNKQDCERKAFERLAGRIKAAFPKLKITLLVDGLYACGPVIRKCREYGWGYMIVLKEDSLKDVWHEALGLMRLSPENSLNVKWGEREQLYAWANDIEYEHGENRSKKENVHVVICYETWQENHSQSTKEVEEKKTRYAWISSAPLNHRNVFLRCTKMGRYRWQIENNILTEKHQGYGYEHCYSYTWNAMEGYHYLMKIGRFLNVMALNSELLVEHVKELGIRGFIVCLKTACRGNLLNREKLTKATNKEVRWRLIA
jgi:hypothetical protein